jgi:hypothetical protein
MKWVTRKHIRTNRLATAWLIRRFVDPAAEFVFVEPAEVISVQERDGAIGFDAPGAVYSHDRGITSFEQIVHDRKLRDPILRDLALIIHAADIQGKLHLAPEAAGLQAISRGFPLTALDDHETVERGFFLYDALYASLKTRRETEIR